MATKTKTTSKKKTTTTRAPAAAAGGKYASQVAAETTLKFGPEDSQLAAALRDAESTYGSDVTAARGTRRAIEDAAKTSKPMFEKNTAVARADVDKTQAELDANLRSLPNAGALAGAASRDSEGTRRRLSEMLANAKTESDTRQREAVTGEAYAVQAAGGRLSDTKGKIADRLSAQAQEKGAYAAARSGELDESAADRATTERGQTLTAEQRRKDRESRESTADADRKSREEIAADKNKPKGPGSATPEKTEKVKTALARAIAQAQRLKDTDNLDRRTAGQQLISGRQDQTIKNAPKDGKIGGKDYKSGDQLDTPIKIPGVRATEQLYASVALDLAYDGHLSTANMKKLQRLGLSVRELGLPTAGRSGTEATQRAADEAAAAAAANPVKPKTLPSGIGALIPTLRRR